MVGRVPVTAQGGAGPRFIPESGAHRGGEANRQARCARASRPLARPVMARWTLPAPMQRALALAQDAARAGEVPIGAVVTLGERIVAEAHNEPRRARDPTAHAELLAIRRAAAALGQERLAECALWVTLEPCAMCAGAIVLARIARRYYAASDPKGGAVIHGPRFFDQPTCHWRPTTEGGLEAQAAADLLRGFFRARRAGTADA